MRIHDNNGLLCNCLGRPYPGKLNTKAKKAIQKADEKNGLLMCDISIWEISMLVKRKRI